VSVMGTHQVVMNSSLVEKVQTVAQSHNEEEQKQIARKRLEQDRLKATRANELERDHKVENRRDREKKRGSQDRGGESDDERSPAPVKHIRIKV